MAWAKLYDKCQACGTTKEKHRARGFCVACYERKGENLRKSHITRRIGQPLSIKPTKDNLTNLYRSGLSLIDIARRYNCTRQYIHKLMKLHGIARRELRGSTGAARLAIARGKRPRWHSTDINEDFFSSWNPEMAYVVGVLCSDGNLESAGYRFSFSQKDPELLIKIRALMKSNHELRHSPKRGVAGAIYHLYICNVKMYEGLVRLGLTPKKSLTVKFPPMPSDCVRHFIRGCWDGDGSIYFEGKNLSKPRASYVSGSKVFMQRMVTHLADLGLSIATIHTDKRSGASYIKYGPGDCAKLYHVLYDGVDGRALLNRKHQLFKAAAEIIEFNEYPNSRRSPRRRPLKRARYLSEELRAATMALKNEMGILGKTQ